LSLLAVAGYSLAVNRRAVGFGQGIAMNGSIFLNKKVFGAAVVVLLAGAAVLVWIERIPLLTSYYVHNLANASEADQAVWVNRLAGLGEPAMSDVLDCLNDASPQCCCNARAALEKLTSDWGAGDPRTVALALRCGREFQHMSPAGQRNVMDLAVGWFAAPAADSGNAAALVPPCSRLLAEAVDSKDADVQEHALELCAVLARQPQGNESLSSARDLVRTCLSSARASVRMRAVQLTTHPGMDLGENVVLRLTDSEVQVRRAAVLALSRNDAVLEDVLFPCLHDSDAEVRTEAADALRDRGRTPQQISLARLYSSPNPSERNKVFQVLLRTPDLDLNLWLQLLSHNASWSVRSNTLSAMALANPDAMRPRVEEMAEQDPQDTVRDLARMWLKDPGAFRPKFPD
jgi:hypothetical protein